MRKNIVLLICLIISVISVVMAFIKNDEAIKRTKDAIASQQEAERQVEIAEMRAAETKAVLIEAEKIRLQLEACQSR